MEDLYIKIYRRVERTKIDEVNTIFKKNGFNFMSEEHNEISERRTEKWMK